MQDWLNSTKVVDQDFPYPCQDSAVHHLFSDGWLWQLQFENGLTSLGYVFAVDELRQPHVSHERLWSSLYNNHPILAEIIGDATLTKFPGRLYRTGRLQRLRSVGAGDDWAALPFTVGFIDPLHSTGIGHTLSGVERVSRILLTTSDNQRSRALHRYSSDLIDELLHIDRLVAGCYDGLRDFRMFTAWSMLYFAAATTFERRWLEPTDVKPGFLCADDREFVQLVANLRGVQRSLCETSALSDGDKVATLRACARCGPTVQPCRSLSTGGSQHVSSRNR